MSSPDSSVVTLRCSVQNYDWGKMGNDSFVSRLISSADDKFEIVNETHYAELWIGTHKNGPSYVLETDELLEDYLTRNPDFLGLRYHSVYPAVGQLPFIFKVLSIGKPLSIQLHPNKNQAEELHAKSPSRYPDCNHKPEMAIAISDFKAMVGFRPIAEIRKFLTMVQELAYICGEDNLHSLMSEDPEVHMKALADCFCNLIKFDEPNINELLMKTIKKIKQEIYPVSEMNMTFLGLTQLYPGDKSSYCIYFLNIITLQPGQAIFIGANVPHAYLYGDCLECMACSDNVIRAGLTSKFIDVDELCRLVDYTCIEKSQMIMTGKNHPYDPIVTIYQPPIDEFIIHKYKIPAFCRKYTVTPYDGPSILLVIDGVGELSCCGPIPIIMIKPGSVIFVAANKTVNLKNNLEHANMIIYRAYCSVASSADKVCKSVRAQNAL